MAEGVGVVVEAVKEEMKDDMAGIPLQPQHAPKNLRGVEAEKKHAGEGNLHGGEGKRTHSDQGDGN